MSWDEWAWHEGITLAARGKKGEVTPAELAVQAAVFPLSSRRIIGIARCHPSAADNCTLNAALRSGVDHAVSHPATRGLAPIVADIPRCASAVLLPARLGDPWAVGLHLDPVQQPADRAVFVTKRVKDCVCRHKLAHGLFIHREPCQQ